MDWPLTAFAARSRPISSVDASPCSQLQRLGVPACHPATTTIPHIDNRTTAAGRAVQIKVARAGRVCLYRLTLVTSQAAPLWDRCHDEVLRHVYPPPCFHYFRYPCGSFCEPDCFPERSDGRQPTRRECPSDAFRSPHNRVRHFHLLLICQRARTQPLIRERGLKPHIISPHEQGCDGTGEETVSGSPPNLPSSQ